jgi:hypothetical protein
VKEKNPDLRQNPAEETAPIEEEDVPSTLWTRVTMIQVKISSHIPSHKKLYAKECKWPKYFRVTLSI